MASERRKAKHAYAASFEREVGSSFDPNMEDFEQMEAHFVQYPPPPREPSPPPDVGSEIYLPDDFEVPPEDVPSTYTSSEYGGEIDVEMEAEATSSAFSSPTTSPSKASHLRHLPAQSSFMGMLLASPCPTCHAPYSLHVDDEVQEPAFMCAVCSSSFRLGSSQSSWNRYHVNHIA